MKRWIKRGGKGLWSGTRQRFEVWSKWLYDLVSKSGLTAKSCSMCVHYLRGSCIEGDPQEGAEPQTSCHRQRHQQDPRQPHGTLRLGTVPPQHGQTRISKLCTNSTHMEAVSLWFSNQKIYIYFFFFWWHVCTISRYPLATRITLISEKDLRISSRVVVVKDKTLWDEFAATLCSTA